MSGQNGMTGEENTAAPVSLLTPELQALKECIVAEIEAKQSQKEESLWRRGQAEIRSLKQELSQVTQQVAQLQEAKTALQLENQNLKSAMANVVSKFEFVVKEMSEVVRTLPATAAERRIPPSPSAASTVATAASEVKRDDRGMEPTPGSCASTEANLWSAERAPKASPSTPLRTWRRPEPSTQSTAPTEDQTKLLDGALEEALGLLEERLPRDRDHARDRELRQFSTPPRMSGSVLDRLASPEGPMTSCSSQEVLFPQAPASWRGPVSSPAPIPVISLANALNPSPVQLSPTPQRLNLLDHLDLQDPPVPQVPLIPPIPEHSLASPNPSRRLDFSAAGPTTPIPRSYDFLQVELVKEPNYNSLGIEVDPDEKSLRIEKVAPTGLIHYFNSKQDEEKNKVGCGDCIIEVNGIHGEPDRMLHEIKVRTRLVLTLKRRSAEDSKDSRAMASEGSDEAAGAAQEGDELPKLMGSPATSQLRPQAEEFVPKDVSRTQPPGLERPRAS